MGAAFGESARGLGSNANEGGMWRVASRVGTRTRLARAGCELALGGIAHLDTQGRELVTQLI
jgi:hypothetical protein